MHVVCQLLHSDGWLLTESENGQARLLLYRNFLFKLTSVSTKLAYYVLTAAQYGKKVAVLDYVSPSTQGETKVSVN